MPHYPVLQPDGQLAIWSTVVDSFTRFNYTQEEACAEIAKWHEPDKIAESVAAVATGKIPFDFWRDWPECLAWAMYMYGSDDETVKAALERTPDAMTRRYVEQFVATCNAETTADDLRSELAAATVRAEKAEVELATLRRYADDADRATAERIARIDKLEAKLDAVPVEALLSLRVHLSDSGEYSFCRTDGEAMWMGDFLILGSLFVEIDAWLAQQSEVQP